MPSYFLVSRKFAVSRYVIWPRPAGDGFNLAGTRLPYTLWHRTEFNALEYAHWHMRETGGQVTVLDRNGYPIITERGEHQPPAGPYFTAEPAPKLP